MLQRGKDATVPFTGDGGALGALTALATQAAVQSNVQQLSWAKEQVPRSMYSIMFSRWVDGWMDYWQIVKFGLQVFLQWLWSYHVQTTFVSRHCSTYCKWWEEGPFEEQNMLQEQFAFHLSFRASHWLSSKCEESFLKRQWTDFKVMENAWLCTCFPVRIFHIQCRSFVVLLVIMLNIFHISTCNLQPDADLRERLNLINGLQEVRAASLKEWAR